MKDSAEVVAVRARELAGSERVAGTIKAGAVGASAYVQIGSAKVPEALLLEIGNASSARSLLTSERSGTFKHPVFARKSEGRDEWTWVNDQPMHPCVGPAAAEMVASGELVAKLCEGVNRAMSSVGLTME